MCAFIILVVGRFTRSSLHIQKKRSAKELSSVCFLELEFFIHDFIVVFLVVFSHIIHETLELEWIEEKLGEL